MSGLTLDAGALIAFERNERAIVAIVARAWERKIPLVVPAGVVAQVWRNGRRQARLARLRAAAITEIESLDDQCARAAGQLCGVSGTTDIVDASVVLCARKHGYAVATSDESDLRRLDPTLRYVSV